MIHNTAPMSELLFREATVADVVAIAHLVNAAYRGESSRAGWTTEADLLGGQRTDVESIQEKLKANDLKILVLLKDNLLIGCVELLHNTPSSVYIGMLSISPTSQAQGLGRGLLHFAESWAQKHWAPRRFEMTVISKRPELIAWYERRGYQQSSERRPFPMGDPRFGLPLVEGLEFCVLEKVTNI